MVLEANLNIRPVSAALRRKAEEELNETPDKIFTNLNILQDWMKEQPHLRKIQPKNQWLIAFLRGCKYDIEKAKKKIDTYYTLKATVPELYGNRDPFDPVIQEILKAGAYLPVRKCMSDDAPRLCITNLGNYYVLRKPLYDYLKVVLMITEILLLEDDNFVIAGEDVLGDTKDVELRFLLQFTPSLAKKVMYSVEKALTVRMKSLHNINPMFGVQTVLAIFKMFLGAKMRTRIQTYSNKETDRLYQFIDKSILPEEYGGTDGTMLELTDYWKEKVESYRDWFLDENACSDESKRIDHKKPIVSLVSNILVFNSDMK